MSRRALLPVAGLVLAIGLLMGMSVAAGASTAARAQDDAPSVSVPHIIPQPNSGQAPKVQGDPGSTAQNLVFWGMCVGLLVIGGLVVLESRRKLRARAEAEAEATRQAGAGETRSSTRSDPVAETSAKSPESIARQ
jgi:hypothetical protein